MNRKKLHKNFNPNGSIEIAKVIDKVFAELYKGDEIINEALICLYSQNINDNIDTEEIEALYIERTGNTCIDDL